MGSTSTFVAPSTQGAPDANLTGTYGAEEYQQPFEIEAATTSYPASASNAEMHQVLQLVQQERNFRTHDEVAALALYEQGSSQYTMLESLLSYATDDALLTDFIRQGLLVNTLKGVQPGQLFHDDLGPSYAPPRFAAGADSPVVWGPSGRSTRHVGRSPPTGRR